MVSLTIDGKTYALEKNFRGLHNIHGGSEGAGNRNWEVVAVGPDYVTLTIQLGDGEMGFPGNLSITCTYMLESKGIAGHLAWMPSRTSRPSATSLITATSISTMAAQPSALDHQVRIDAQAYLPVDADLIPDGRVLPVAGTDA